MLLVDTTPETMKGGHVAVKASCDDNGVSAIQVLQGVAEEEMNSVVLDDKYMLQHLSTLGESCLYHIAIPENPEWDVMDIAIFNPNNEDVMFSPGDSVTVYVNAFGMPEGNHDGSETEESDHGEQSTGENTESDHKSTNTKESHDSVTDESSHSTDMMDGSAYAEIEKIFGMGSNTHVVKIKIHAGNEDLPSSILIIESDSGKSQVSVPSVSSGDSILVPGTISAMNTDSITVKLQ